MAEEEGQRLHPRVKTLWWISGFLSAVVGTIVVLPALLIPGFPGWPVGLWAALLFGAAALVPVLRYRRWRYAMRETDLYLSKGAILIVKTLIPFDRIQFVETREGPLDRLLDLTQVIIYTAAGRAGHIPGLDAPQAEALRDQLSKVAGTTSV